MSGEALALLSCLLIGHFLGDFTPLATARMQEAKASGGPQLPIIAHAGVHAAFTGIAVLLVARPTLDLLAIAVAIQFASHWALDAFRARVGLQAPALSDPSNNAFWTALGLDQLVHALVLLGIASLVV
jgi:hypothetical protein